MITEWPTLQSPKRLPIHTLPIHHHLLCCFALQRCESGGTVDGRYASMSHALNWRES